MCLGTIAKVVEVHGDGRAVVEHAPVDHGVADGAGRREEVLLLTVADDDIEPGDWVVIHSGFALERISAERAADALAIRATEPPATDPHAADPHAANPDTTPGASASPQHKEMAP